VLGDRHRRHAQLLRLIEQLLDPARAIEERVFRVEVEMDEVTHRESPNLDIAKSPASPADYSHSIVEGGFDEMS
jgi:hypothetical protein